MRRNIEREMRSTIEVFARSCGRRPFGFRDQGRFAEQRARAGDDFGLVAAFGRKTERAALNDVAAIGGLADGEQRLAGLHAVAFGADGDDAQRAGTEPAENRYPFQERDVVFDRHDGRGLRHQFIAAGFGDQD